MNFCGYCNRASILKLKDKDEFKKMFKFVVDRQELVSDKNKMFGIFASNPALLTILPGLEPTFKRFLSKVEEIIPKTKVTVNASSKPVKERKTTDISSTSKTPSNDELSDRLTSWVLKKASENNKKELTNESVKQLFKIESLDENKFKFTCKQSGCSENILLHLQNGRVSMSNIHRHLQNSCWLSGKRTNSKITNSTKVHIDLTERYFKPKCTSDVDLEIEAPPAKEAKLNLNDQKNLQAPVGTKDLTEPSGH